MEVMENNFYLTCIIPVCWLGLEMQIYMYIYVVLAIEFVVNWLKSFGSLIIF